MVGHLNPSGITPLDGNIGASIHKTGCKRFGHKDTPRSTRHTQNRM